MTLLDDLNQTANREPAFSQFHQLSDETTLMAPQRKKPALDSKATAHETSVERSESLSDGESDRLEPSQSFRTQDLEQLYRPIALTDPRRLVFPPPWIGHIPFAFWIIDALRPKSLVELGAHSGNSYCAFLQAIVSCGLPTSCYAVDTWVGDSHAGNYGDDVYNDLLSHHDEAYAGFSKLLRMTFDEALGYFADSSIDLLHIDGLHTYEAVLQDFKNWLPKMSDHGVVLMHDTMVRERDFGVWRVWDEIRATYPSFSFSHSNGLGVAYVGRAEMPESIRWLMATSADPDRQILVRRHFDRLGQGLIDRFWAQHRVKVIADLNEHANALVVQVVDRDHHLGVANDHLGAANDHINHQAQDIERWKKRCQNLTDDLLANQSLLEEMEVSKQSLLEEMVLYKQRLEAVHQSTSWRITAGLRWLTTRVRGTVAKMRFVTGISRRALPMFARDPGDVGRTVRFLLRHGPRPTWRHIIEKVRKSEAGAAFLPPVPAHHEVARPIDIDHSVAVPLGYSVAALGSGASLAVICHIFHENLAVEFRRYFLNIPISFDLFISTDDLFKKSVIEKMFSGWDRGKVEIRITRNRGRDVAPKLIGFRDVYDRYDLILHLHSKRSDHASVLADWRGFVLENMLGSKEIVEGVLGIFAQRPDIGLIASQHYEPMRHWVNWGNNFVFANGLAKRMGFSLSETDVLDFPSGSMFWARSAALKPLLDLELSYDDFHEERGQVDGTMAHAIERLYYYVCERAGFAWVKVARPVLFENTPAIISIASEAALDRFIADHGLKLTGGDLPKPRTVHPTPIAQPPKSLITHRTAGALGLDLVIAPETTVAIGIVTYNIDQGSLRRIIESARIALEQAGCSTTGSILIIDNGAATEAMTAQDASVRHLVSEGNIGFGAGHNRLMAKAFETGVDYYIGANPDGAFHPNAVSALLKMMLAHQGRALIESTQFPTEHPKPYDPFTFETPWISGACLMIPRQAFEELGGFDETFFMYCEDVDLSWRARANGFVLRICPASLFLHEVTNRPRDPKVLRMIFDSGVILARKWGAPEFETWLTSELAALDHLPPDAQPTPVPGDWSRYAEFSHHFSFAKARW